MKKLISIFLIFVLISGALTSCGKAEDDKSKKSKETGSVYFLNFKPEAESAYREVASAFTDETGIPINIVTASAGSYEQTLTSEIVKSDAPTIFQVNGPIGYRNWSDYCMDLSDTKLYSMLNDKSLAITEDGGVFAVPYTIEGYGILYNDKIMQKYFEMNDSKVNSVDEIKDFESFKAVVEDMTAKKNDLGIEGVFSSTSLASGEQWRWTSHLANNPFFYEFKELSESDNPIDMGLSAETVNFKYDDNYRKLFDLYINNSVTSQALISGKTTADSMSEFALGKSAMVQNGNWAMSQIENEKGSVVEAEDVKIMPILMGIDGEENYGICVGTENYLAINSEVSEADQKASVEFLEWLFSSETGKQYVKNELGFLAPFNTFDDDEMTEDLLGRQVLEWTAKKGVTSVPWVFTSFPSEEFKNQFGNSLIQYAQGNIEWKDVKNTVIKKWKEEHSLIN